MFVTLYDIQNEHQQDVHHRETLNQQSILTKNDVV